MTYLRARAATLDSALLSIAAAAVMGLALLSVGGFASAAGLHGAAHDARHANVMPCH
mgnify:CR=1 FL=1